MANEIVGEQDGEHITEPPYAILFLFGCCSLGALVRTLLKVWSAHFPKLPLPYTVALLILGSFMGLISKQYESVGNYTKMAQMDPQIILHIFLPVLIFESAFAMEAHTFFRSFMQIVTLALPGLLVASFLTAIMAMNVFDYGWSFEVSLLFGSIVSATDPVAVVSLLKDLGASKQLATTIEGESLLNDGAAIVMFNVLLEMADPMKPTMGAGDIVLKFVRIAIGGPVFGFIMSKITIFWLSNIFNDAITEITITLAATYVTFYVGEAVLEVSGVLAVVVLGITLSAERTVISPEVEGSLHRFWEMLAYLANTLIFILVGVVITEQAMNDINEKDWFYMLVLYFGVNIIRGITITLFSPVLKHMGYGLTWRDATVMTWGGLRGAVCVALSLLVYRTDGVAEAGKKMVIHVAAIVVLSLGINATTIASVLDLLGMTDISPAKRMAMANVVRHLKETKHRALNVLKIDRFLADSDWAVVENSTLVTDPYHTHEEQLNIEENFEYKPQSRCPECRHVFPTEPTPTEYRDMYNEATLRKLKAHKVSYWRQFEHGILSSDSVRVLVGYVESSMDLAGSFINLEEVKKNWQITGIYPFLKRKLESVIYGKSRDRTFCPRSKWRAIVYKITVNSYFEAFIYSVIMLNMVPVIFEFRVSEDTQILYAGNKTHTDFSVVIAEEDVESGVYAGPWISYVSIFDRLFALADYRAVLSVVNYIFFGIYIGEATFKIASFGVIYFKDHWNQFDLLIILLSVVDVVLEAGIAKIFRLLRISRVFRLFKALIPRIIDWLDERINRNLSFGYDVGKGFVVGEEEVSKYIEQMVDNANIAKSLKEKSVEQRLEVIKELGLLQRSHPGIAISVKTRQSIRTVLNVLRDDINEQREGGLLDDREFGLLIHMIEERMKKLMKLPSSIPPPDPLMILRNVPWLAHDEKLISFIRSRAKLQNYDYRNTLLCQGDKPNGIHVIVSGMVRMSAKIKLDTSKALVPQHANSLQLLSQCEPLNTEFEDYLTAGNVLGEMGIMTLRPRAATITCETSVQTYFVSLEDMFTALDTFTEQPSLEYRLWRICAIRIALPILMSIDAYQGFTQERVKLLLQRAFLPRLDGVKTLSINEEIMEEVIVIQGAVLNANTREEFIGPCYIPKSVHKLTLQDRKYMEIQTKILVVPTADYDYEYDLFGPGPLCLLHASQHRLDTQSKLSLAKSKSTFSSINLLRKRSSKPSKLVLESVEDGKKKAAVEECSGHAAKAPKGHKSSSPLAAAKDKVEKTEADITHEQHVKDVGPGSPGMEGNDFTTTM
ncbi:PREDICTED: sodium/hydrogen exchanger 10-like [Priapulus caudatus]|uniref:Sodium/hydrogen exchanger 10-like n=1 Tax=Priapulus caudatus TaxID=37621 RepID=A0ABM1EG67_PRICU|nr:PREDICTED: sodium/hydrogen exchanger 10-like [Priapulus caudatus]